MRDKGCCRHTFETKRPLRALRIDVASCGDRAADSIPGRLSCAKSLIDLPV